MNLRRLHVRCPSCGKTVVRSRQTEAPFFPFCSERCKLVDLGKWFDEEHRISETSEPDSDAPPDEQNAG